MDMTNNSSHGAPRFAPASRAGAHAHPGRVRVTSEDAGWTSLLVVARERDGTGRGDATEFESLPTPDQTVVVSTRGEYELECFARGAWGRAVRQPGSGGLTPGGAVDRLRWRARTAEPIHTVHLYLPPVVFEEVGDHFRRAGAASRAEPLASIGFRDPVVTEALLALVRAARAGAPDLYAEAAAQYLATHLLSPHSRWPGAADDRRAPGALTDRRLARVAEYVSAHFGEPLTLDRLAGDAGVSKFHFVRLFRAAVGETPHAYLVRVRLDAAGRLLRDTDLSVAAVAAACGYPRVAHFGAAFVRHAGRTPTAFRAAARR